MVVFEIIRCYQKEVAFFVELMKKEFSCDDVLSMRRSRKVDQKGELPGGYTYYFHGIGCEISYNNEENWLDFDFGPGGRYDGFDKYRIKDYAEHWRESPPQEWLDCDVGKEFDKLVASGKIFSPENSPDNLYYFADDFAARLLLWLFEYVLMPMPIVIGIFILCVYFQNVDVIDKMCGIGLIVFCFTIWYILLDKVKGKIDRRKNKVKLYKVR